MIRSGVSHVGLWYVVMEFRVVTGGELFVMHVWV